MFSKRAEMWKQRAMRVREEKNRVIELNSNLSRELERVSFENAQLAASNKSLEVERATLERLMARLAEQNTAVMERVDLLMREVIGLASRKPDYPDYAQVLREMASGMSLILNGSSTPVQPVSNGHQTPQPMPDMFADLDNMAGIRPGMIPIHEYDPLRPTNNDEMSVGEWNAHTPLIPSQVNPNEIRHVFNPQKGTVERADGMPMFLPGQTAPPPGGGLE